MSGKDTLYIDQLSRMIFQRAVPTLGRLYALIRIIPWVRRSDIVHVHMPYPFMDSCVSFSSRILRKKLVGYPILSSKGPLMDLRFWSHVPTDYADVFNGLVQNIGVEQTTDSRLETLDERKTWFEVNKVDRT